MSNPLVSVIIPCYNAEKFLPKCFNCLDKQTYKDLHVIFINDGSTDDTLKLLEEYCEKHAEYTLLSSGENRGVATAKNKGLDAVKGEFFCFYDADDIVLDDHFETLVRYITKPNADMAVCGTKRISEKRAISFDASKKAKRRKTRFFDKTQALEQFFSQEIFDYLLVNKIFSMAIMQKSGAHFLDGCRYGEEGYFFFRYLSCAEKTVYYGAKSYDYVQNKHSLMHSAFSEKRLDIYTNMRAVIGEMTGKDEFESVMPYVKIMRAGYSVGVLHFILHGDYDNSRVIASVVNCLRNDVKYVKKCPKIALYKKLLLPFGAVLANILFRKHIKKYPDVSEITVSDNASAI